MSPEYIIIVITVEIVISKQLSAQEFRLMNTGLMNTGNTLEIRVWALDMKILVILATLDTHA